MIPLRPATPGAAGRSPRCAAEACGRRPGVSSPGARPESNASPEFALRQREVAAEQGECACAATLYSDLSRFEQKHPPLRRWSWTCCRRSRRPRTAAWRGARAYGGRARAKVQTRKRGDALATRQLFGACEVMCRNASVSLLKVARKCTPLCMHLSGSPRVGGETRQVRSLSNRRSPRREAVCLHGRRAGPGGSASALPAVFFSTHTRGGFLDLGSPLQPMLHLQMFVFAGSSMPYPLGGPLARDREKVESGLAPISEDPHVFVV